METETLLKIRSEFPSLENKIILSSCSQSAISLDVLDAMEEYKNSLLEDGMSWETWMVKVNNAKEKFSRIINCNPDEIAILSSVSDSISSILHSLDLNNQEVCVTEMDFPCIGHAVLAQQKKQNFKVTFIPAENNVIPIDHYEKYIHENTGLTCVSHVSYYNGFKQNIKEIAKIAHRNDSLLFVDAYQSAGGVNIDVKEMDIDILVAGMQKYLLGVPGISFMYIKKEIAEKLSPTTIGWFGQKEPFAFDLKNLDYANSAQRFNTGTPPVINGYIADAALSFIERIGMETIERHLSKLSYHTIENALQMGFKLASPRDINQKGASTAIYVENANKVEGLLKEAGYVVSARKDVIRIAPHIYNTEDDILNCLKQLEKLI
ncbi:aminotransferase class V-fold PLP-dependent enzyme [Bacillus luteolus]|uniref:Aminotransferase class V-fold PLP-dependent enzyme n=1 Tax=Litchfieldia luteola TaxID=682179 RepID=A0ABR9QJ66_9BACI|nr:aminotransferase class V-fold PLP-dependent enzyme [Cytobacillus luteolus]MBE4908530.1 aminotransferase class V-fold PLP-dependent enzyme [Cytobacillus luteolus]MBP1941382.1 selenocysteine lyase/cysteine desulfurase [Cytobacillus luteolus]